MLGSRSAYTRARIIEAAERLFAQKGHEKTSLREITAEAQVNLSSVNYHFGSKEGLILAVRQQQLAALNQERAALLDKTENACKNGQTSPADVLKAFFGPLLEHAFRRPGTRVSVLPSLEQPLTNPNSFLGTLLSSETDGPTSRFLNILAKALPQLPRQEILWRFQFMLGAAAGAIVGMDGLLFALGRNEVDPPDVDALCERLIAFMAGGLSAPVAVHTGKPANPGLALDEPESCPAPQDS